MGKIDLIKKLKALSKKGLGGEKENASKLLKKLMKKYGISEEELEENEEKIVSITLKNDVEKRICCQVLYAYFKNAPLYKINDCRTKYYTKLTPEKEIEFEYILSIYLKKFYEEQDVFIRAFIQKNNIFPTDGKKVDFEDLSPEEKSKTIKSTLMAKGIEFIEIRKALENQKGEKNGN